MFEFREFWGENCSEFTFKSFRIPKRDIFKQYFVDLSNHFRVDAIYFTLFSTIFMKIRLILDIFKKYGICRSLDHFYNDFTAIELLHVLLSNFAQFSDFFFIFTKFSMIFIKNFTTFLVSILINFYEFFKNFWLIFLKFAKCLTIFA